MLCTSEWISLRIFSLECPWSRSNISPLQFFFLYLLSQRTRASPPSPITQTRNVEVVFDFSTLWLHFQSMVKSRCFRLCRVSPSSSVLSTPRRHQLMPGDGPLSPESLFPKPDFSPWLRVCSSLAHSPHSSKGDLSETLAVYT